MELRVSRYVVVSDPVRSPADGRKQRAVFSTRSGSVRPIDARLWASLSKGDFTSVPRQLIKELKACRVLVDQRENEPGLILAENRRAIRRSARLYLVVHPTADCQLACDYCGQRHVPRKLSRTNQDLLVQRVREKLSAGGGRYREFKVGWFGAEPLLGLAVMRALSKRFAALAKDFKCAYRAALTSNGVQLSHKVAGELVRELGVVEIELTLDGSQGYHDRRRPLKNGGGTFRTILENVSDLVARDDLEAKVSIRCNVDRRNADGVVPLLELAGRRGLAGRIEKFYVSPVRAWGNDADKLSLTPGEFASRELEWFAHMARLGFRVALVPDRRKEVCMGVNPRSELVDAWGDLYKCTEVSQVPAYELPARLRQGNARARRRTDRFVNVHSIGSLAGDEAPGPRILFEGMNDRIERLEVPCHACAMLPVCAGSCPKAWSESRLACPPMKYNMPQRLVLLYYLTGLGVRPLRVSVQPVPGR